MLSHLAQYEDYFGPLRLFGSITVRTMFAAITERGYSVPEQYTTV